MPGLASCGRCGSPLNLDSIAIDVHPPRASRASKRLRRWIPRRSLYRARDRASEELRRTADHLMVDQRLPLPERGTAHRLLVPGWAHLHMGLTIRGRVFLGAYLLLLVLGMIGLGERPGSDVPGAGLRRPCLLGARRPGAAGEGAVPRDGRHVRRGLDRPGALHLHARGMGPVADGGDPGVRRGTPRHSRGATSCCSTAGRSP